MVLALQELLGVFHFVERIDRQDGSSRSLQRSLDVWIVGQHEESFPFGVHVRAHKTLA
jgi:hypothetical protein